MADELKDVRPYLNLAESFEDSDPMFSYYIRKYCIQKTHQIYTALKTTNPHAAEGVFAQLTEMMGKAEQLSKQLTGQIDVTSNLAQMLEYTQRVFLAADNDYRAKNISPQLTQNFMTAWRFYEVINHFNALSEDQAKRLKYSKVKTVEVHKLIKQMQSNQNQEYRPEPPQVTPGGGQAYNSPPVQSPPPQNNGYPQIPGMQMPQMPQMGGFSPFAPPAFSTGQPNVQPAMGMPNMGMPDMGMPAMGWNQPPQQAYTQPPQQAYTQPGVEVKKDKKRIDPQRIGAQNQAMSQLQNAISELGFNRTTYAKQAIRNAMKLLEKYD